MNKKEIKGVSWDNIRNKWYSRITFAGVRYAIGRFHTYEQAAEAYKIAKEMGPSEFKAWYNKDPKHRGSLLDTMEKITKYEEEEEIIKKFSFFVDGIEEDKNQYKW